MMVGVERKPDWTRLSEGLSGEREATLKGASVNLTKFIRVNWMNDSKRRRVKLEALPIS